MGSSKRERQKAGRQARIEEAHRLDRRASMRKRTIMVVGIVVAVLAVAFLLSLRGGEDEDASSASDSSPSTTTADGSGETPPPGPGAEITGETPCPPTDGSAERTTSFENAPPDCLEDGVDYTAVFDTTEGEIRVDLDEVAMPGTVNNFVTLARYGYYDDTTIFRTDTSIEIIQGGAPITNDPADPGPGYTIEDEAEGFTYEAGQLVMARSQGPDSSGAQFFFVAGPNAGGLDSDGSFLVFGEADDAGLTVVQTILALNEGDPTSPLGGAPSRPVIVNSVTIEEN
jgi:cyclophilin family peptidyl-prolyl cis-trans isomerase